MTSLSLSEPRIACADSDDPGLEIRAGAALTALFFVGLLGSAAVLPLDQAEIVPGSVMVAGHRQAIQSREGGVVTALKVADGDKVSAGQLLVSFAAADDLAVEKSLASRVLTKEAELARLHAEQTGSPTVVLPPDRAASLEDRTNQERARAIAQSELSAQRASDAARRAVLKQRAQEAGEQITGYSRQLLSNARQQQLNNDELTGMRSLQLQGYAPATRVRELERAAASLVGDAGSETAEIARLRATQGEARLQNLEADSERSKEVADELDKAQAELQELLPQLNAAREALARTEIRAPVSGSVVAETINMAGAVAAPGQKLMELVPSRQDYIIEAHVAPRYIEGFQSGKVVQVQFAGLHDRRIGALKATLTRVSADALVDEKTGQPYYIVSASVPRSQIERLPRDDDFAIKPGMPVSLTVTVQRRTALQYLLGPLAQSLSASLHER